MQDLASNMDIILTALILLVFAIIVRTMAHRLVPVAIPPGQVLGIGTAFIGAVAGNWIGNVLLPRAPALVGVNLIPAVAGAILLTLLVGLAPFLRILMGRG